MLRDLSLPDLGAVDNLRRQFDATALDQIRQYEQMKKMLEPLRISDFQADLRKLLAPNPQITSALEASRLLAERAVEGFTRAHEATRLQTEAYALAMDAARHRHLDELQKSVAALPRIPDFRSLRDQLGLDGIDAAVRSFRAHIERDSLALSSTIDALTASMTRAASLLQPMEIVPSPVGFRVDGVDVDKAEVRDFLAGEGIAELPASAESIAALAAKLDYFTELVVKRTAAKPRSVVVIRFLLNVLLQLLIGITGAELQTRWHASHSERKAAVRAVQEDVGLRAATALDTGIPRSALDSFRVVTAPALVMRAKPTKNSARISELPLGQVVCIVRSSKRSWTLVEWSPDEDVSLQGWVYSRYLARIRLPKAAQREPNAEQ